MVPFDGPRNLTRDGAELSLEGMTMDCASPQPANRVLSECSDRVGALPFEEITCYHPIAIRYIIHCNTAVGNGTATAMMVADMVSDRRPVRYYRLVRTSECNRLGGTESSYVQHVGANSNATYTAESDKQSLICSPSRISSVRIML